MSAAIRMDTGGTGDFCQVDSLLAARLRGVDGLFNSKQSQRQRHNPDQSQRPSIGKVPDLLGSAAPDQQQHLGVSQRSPLPTSTRWASAPAPTSACRSWEKAAAPAQSAGELLPGRAQTPSQSAMARTSAPALAPAVAPAFPLASAAAAASGPVSARAGRQASEEGFTPRCEAEFARLGKEVMTRENMGELLTAYMKREEHTTQAAEADTRMTKLEKTIQGQQVETGELKGQAEMQKTLQEEQVETIRDLRQEMDQLRTWRDQSVPKQAEMQKRLEEQAQIIQGLHGWREQSTPRLAEMQKRLQDQEANGKQVVSAAKSQQSGLEDCRRSLLRLQEEAGSCREGLRALGEHLQKQVATLAEQVAWLAGLVRQLDEGLRGTREEINRGMRAEASELKTCRDQNVRMQAALQSNLQDGQALTKRLDKVEASLQGLQGRQGRQEEGQQKNVTMVAKLSENVKGLQGLQVEATTWRQKMDERTTGLVEEMRDDLQGLQGLQEKMDERVKTLGEQLRCQREDETARLATLSQDLQRLQGLQEEGQQKNSAMVAKLSEDLQGLQGLTDERVKTLGEQLQSQQEQVDSETARLDGLVGQLVESLQGVREEMSQGLREEAGTLKARQDYCLHEHAETLDRAMASFQTGQHASSSALAKVNDALQDLRGLVGQLQEGLQGAREDNTTSSIQLSNLHADLHQHVEEGTLTTNRLATELKALQDSLEGLRGLQAEQRRHDLSSLRRDLTDVQDGVCDVRNQMRFLSGTGAA